MNTRKYIYTFIAFATFALVSCGSRGASALQTGDTTSTVCKYTPPAPPLSLPDDQKLNYVADHYWDEFNFSDTNWIRDTAVLEQLFVDWTFLLSNLPSAQNAVLLGKPVKLSTSSKEMTLRFADLAEHYWGNPRSPYYNEEFCISFINEVVTNSNLDTLDTFSYRSRLYMMKKNRPGSDATDFTFTNAKGTKMKLSSVLGQYTILMFYNPECSTCAQIESYLSGSALLERLRKDGILKYVCICPDGDLQTWFKKTGNLPQGWLEGNSEMGYGEESAYYLPLIPTIYVLKGREIIIKDAMPEAIESYFAAVRRSMIK